MWPDPAAWYEPVSTPAAKPMPDGYVVHMPRTAAQPHLLGEAVTVSAHQSISGYEQHEKTCAICGAVRVLVIPTNGDAWREWREKDAVTQSRWPAVCEVTK